MQLLQNVSRRLNLKRNSARVPIKDKEMAGDSTDINLSEADRLANESESEQETMDELNKALAEARLKGQKGLQESTNL